MKFQMQKNLRQSGFGIIEIFLMISMVTGMTYFLISRQQAGLKEKERATFDHDMNNVVTLVNQILSHPHHCTATVLAVRGGTGTISSLTAMPSAAGPVIPIKGEVSGGELPSIQLGYPTIGYPLTPGSRFATTTGYAVFSENQEIYPGFEIGRINLANDRVDDFIRIEFKYTLKKKLFSKSGRTINRDFILSTKKDLTTITECRLKVPRDILIQGCLKLGTWDPSNYCNITSHYLKSRDLFPLYDDGLGGYSSISPVAIPPETRCTCPTAVCRVDNENCCTPSTCVGFYVPRTEPPGRSAYMTHYPPVSSISVTSGMCEFSAQCLAKPDVGLVK